MAQPISESTLARFSDFVTANIGLSFPPNRWVDLERGLRRIAHHLSLPGPREAANSLMERPLDRDLTELIASYLTVGETYFFRDDRAFLALERHILPQLIKERRQTDKRIRIWSAACSTGEEPYSIAILLSRLIEDIDEWNLTILGTDINPHFLAKAMRGTYREWSFRGVSDATRKKYFRPKNDGAWELRSEIRRRVTFFYHNLARDPYPSLLNNTNAMDVILCRNALMYFAKPAARHAIDGFGKSLVETGWLIVGAPEVSHPFYEDLLPVPLEGETFYRKPPDIHPQPASPPLISGPPHTLEPAPMPDFEIIKEIEPPLPSVPAEKLDSFHPSLGAPTVITKALELYDLGLYSEAASILTGLTRKELGQAQPVAVTDPKLSDVIARAFANQGRLEEAAEWGEQAVAADKTNPRYQYLLSTILQEQSRFDEARSALERALYLDPGFILAHFSLGNLALQAGGYKVAERHLRRCMELLDLHSKDELLPESEGITAGRLSEIVATLLEAEKAV